MATLEEIVVQLTAETSKLQAEMRSATKVTADAAEKMQKSVDEFAKNSSKSTSFFQSSMATLTGFLGSQAVLAVIGSVKDAFGALSDALLEGVESANKEEDAMKKLATSLALSGNYSSSAVEGLREFSGEMEKQTGIADDVVAGNLAILSSLTKLDSEGLKAAQKSAIDLSAAVGIDLETATRLVGKGIEGNTSAFKKYGITIKEGATDAENFANVVGTLSTRFGDAAKGNLQTFSGGILNLKNAFGNAVEVIGRVITNNDALKTVIAEVSKIFADLEQYVTKNADALSNGFTQAIVGSLNALAIFVDMLDTLVKASQLAYHGIMVVVQGVVDLAQAAIAIKNLDFSGAADAFKETGEQITAVNEIIDGKSTSTLESLRDKLIDIGQSAETAGAKQTKAFTDAKPAVDNQKEAIDQLVSKFYDYRNAVKESQDSAVKSFLDSASAFNAASTLQTETLQTQYDAELISFQEYQDGKMAILQQSQQAELDLLNQYRASGALTEQQYQIAVAQAQAQQANASLKLQTDTNKQRQENFKSTLGTIATLSDSSNKELAAIGKAAAISTATIDGIAAVQKALASAPPPFNFALAGAVGIATAANVAKIAGVGLARGIDSVPGVGTRDNFPAVLAPGERVVPSKSNEDLTNFLAEQDGGGKQPVNINLYMQGVGTITREDAANILEAVNDVLASQTGLRILNT